MGAKRFLDESSKYPDQPNAKRMKTRPSFASVIGEVVMVNCLQNFFSALEPMLRKVVSEEVENGIRKGGSRSLTKSPSMRIQALEPSSLQLVFSKRLSLPIFTGSKIVDVESSPLHILLVDTTSNHFVTTSLSYPLKVEIVVLDGDFPPGDRETWTREEFDKNIVRERIGKRPLLTGDLQVTLRDGFAPVGEIEFTDNSSWIRSRRFRLGARVVQGSSRQGFRVSEAMTEAFVVKDHRGELYKKHHPPMLEDEVWRLEKIGKDGAFHKKLASMGINTVQEFLKLSVVEPSKLKKILGVGMSEKMWEVTVKHARTCVMSNKLYISHGSNYTLVLNPICQVVKAVINGQTYPSKGLTTMNRACLENLVREAYHNWSSLEEVDGTVNETPLLTQGDVVGSIGKSYQQHLFLIDGSMDVASAAINANMECNDWLVTSTLVCSPVEAGVRYNFSECSSDDDLQPPRSYIL
ncbi:protein SAR DEFICIENT 1-like isoform X1 [Actinidia eriantha]|uniref:protein SAR DEFICIENT 1-like isoform X1 n=1 Tax=Actinidia eriantha TaxID=165200 RepID=UPI00258E7EF4|nr:protein SAR DEFICIENT 1-like isoform X1 [Actinidia eriantha]